MLTSPRYLSIEPCRKSLISNGLPKVYTPPVSENFINPFCTLNNQGYMLSYLHKISREFVEFSSHAPGPVLDIGTAYGFVVLEALKRGAYVIANDLELRHLEDLHKRVPQNNLNRISYAVGHVPGEVTFSPKSLGAVLASGVLHYLSPPDFSLAIANIASWLKAGGKFFLATPSPYTNLYEKFFITFQESRELNKQWPGFIEDVSKILPNFFTDVPKSTYLIDEEFIAESLEENGLAVEKIDFFNIKLPTEQFKKLTNVLGIIAHKI
ncbi:MAG: class I SAM-dependent methyltransferase [Alphaproteobacteria bacterium]|nr:class I SAM-dependent methyltransferase [Alphaproteobacteria bacterium]